MKIYNSFDELAAFAATSNNAYFNPISTPKQKSPNLLNTDNENPSQEEIDEILKVRNEKLLQEIKAKIEANEKEKQKIDLSSFEGREKMQKLQENEKKLRQQMELAKNPNMDETMKESLTDDVDPENFKSKAAPSAKQQSFQIDSHTKNEIDLKKN